MPIEPKPKPWRTPLITLNITRQIIDEAKASDSSHCMIADCIRKTVPGARRVAVDIFTCRFTDPQLPRRYAYTTPRQAQIALLAFDQGEHVEPFRMTLRGGQVAVSGPERQKYIDPEKSKQMSKAGHLSALSPNAPYKHSQLWLRKNNSHGSNPPTKVGGRLPGQFAMRREFGARAFARGTVDETDSSSS